MGDLTKNFSLKEFNCKCGCGLNCISMDLVKKLQEARDSTFTPIIVLSGVRCKKHNQEVGGVPKSFHTKGLAVDVSFPTKDLRTLYRILEVQGFNGLGVYPKEGFIHIDLGNRYQRWIKDERGYHYAFR